MAPSQGDREGAETSALLLVNFVKWLHFRPFKFVSLVCLHDDSPSRHIVPLASVPVRARPSPFITLFSQLPFHHKLSINKQP